MPEKQKARSGWKGPHTAIAILAMLTQVALCNIFAGVDRHHIPENASLSILSSAAAPTIAAQPDPAEVSAACPAITPRRNMGAKCIARTRSS